MTILQNKIPLKIPLRFVLAIPFIMVIILTTSIAGYIAFMNGQKAVNDVAHQLRSEISARIEEHLYDFLLAPLQVSQLNTTSIQQGWLNSKNTKELQDYFLEQVKTHKTITSVYFGNIDGGVIGSGREGATESFYVYDTKNLKAGTFNKYAITDTGQIGKLLASVPNFDARARPWYINAVKKGSVTWNAIYILITGQDMTIALSSPVYDNRHSLIGVLSVEIFLSQIENFLKTLDISKTGQSFIMERSGLLVASSTKENPFIKNNDKMGRLDARNSQSPMIKYAAEFLRGRFGENYDVAQEEQFDFDINGKRYFLTVLPVQDPYGIDWLIVVAIPESDFMADIKATNQSTFLVTILALGISILASIFIAGKISSRISYLNESARAFTRGEGTGLISANSRISEIDELTTSFTEMEHQLTQTLNDLRSEVSERKMIGQALHESESLFRAIFEQAAVGAAQIETATGRFIRVNQKYCDIVGYSRAEMEKINFQSISHPDELEADLANTELLKAGKIREFTMEKRYFKKSGETIWVSLTASPMWAAGETPNYHIAIVQDITARKQTEDALQELKLQIGSHELYSVLVEMASDGFWLLDQRFRTVYVNPAIEEMLGYTKDEMVGHSWYDFGDPEWVARAKELEKRREGGVKEPHPFLFIHKDGRKVMTRIATTPLYDADGNFNGALGILSDITRQAEAEEALKVKDMLNAIASSSGIGMALINPDYTIEWYNDQHVRWFGPLEKTKGRNCFEVFEGRDSICSGCPSKVSFEEGAVTLFERTGVTTSEGPNRTIALTTSPMRNAGGDIVQVIEIAQDVTERKQMMDALQKNEEKYRKLVELTPDGLLIHTGGKIVFSNTAAANMMGAAKPDDMIGKNLIDFVHPDYRGVVTERVRQITDNKNNAPLIEEKLVRLDGVVIDAEVAAIPFNYNEGNAVQVIFRDITERKRAEERSRQSEEQYRVLFNNLPIPAFTKDINGIYTSCNKENMKYWSVDPIGHTDAEISSDQMASALQANDRRVIESGETVINYEFLKNTPEGDRLFIAHKAPIRDGNGNIVGVLGASLDITERKRTEDEMLEKSKELEALFTISSHLRTAQTAGDMLPVVLAQMSNVLNADANAVILLDPDQTHFTYAVGDGLLASNTGLQIDVENSISARVLQTRQPYVTLDYAGDPLRSRAIRNSERIGPAVAVPLQSETEFIGALLCARTKDSSAGPFTPTEVQLLVSIGEMVGNALRRARLYDDALSRLQRVEGLRSIDSFINANMDIKITLNLIVNQTLSLMDVDAAAILFYDPNSHMLEYAAAQGFHYKNIEKTRSELSAAFSEKAILERRVVTASDLSEIQDPVHKDMMQKERFSACYITPMIAKGKVIGVLELYKRAPFHSDREWLNFLEALGTQAAIAVDNANLFRDLQSSNLELALAYDATIQGWSHALDLKDKETEGHTLRVTEMTIGIAGLAGLGEKEIMSIRRGALLHDIGKMGVPDHILNKTGKLTAKEWDIIRQHPQYAYDMLRPIEFLRPALDIPHYHHEKWDGTGYPHGLQNLQIPYAARLFAVADVWDALTSDRVYRKAWSKKKVFAHIKEQSGKHFDPQAVELFLKYMDTIAVRKK